MKKATKVPVAALDPVAVVLRVSTMMQAGQDKAGLESQLACCNINIERYDLDPICRKRIVGVSGAAILRTPEMQEVLGLVEEDRIRGIVISEESRLLRPGNWADMAVLQVLIDHNIKLYLRDRIVNLSNPDDAFFAGMNFLFAGRERRLIVDRMVNGKLSKRDRGEWVCGKQAAPYGCTVVTENKRNYLVVDHDPDNDIDKIKRLFELFVGGVTSFGRLHQMVPGVPYHTVKIALSNEVYTGWHVTKRIVHPQEKKRNVYWTASAGPEKQGRLRYQKRVTLPADKQTRIWMLENPPISEETFRIAQALLQQKMNVKRTSEDDPYAYRGFVLCGACGKPLKTIRFSTPTRKKGLYRAEYYICKDAHGVWDVDSKKYSIPPGTCKTRRMRREKLEAILDEIVARQFAQPDLLKMVIAASEKTEDTSGHRIESLEKEIAELDACIERTEEERLRGKISQSKLDQYVEKFNLEKRAARAALAEIRPDFSSITPAMWAPLAEQFQRWDRLNPSQKRTLLSTISPVFKVAGVKGEKYHETNITVTSCQVNITGKPVDSSALSRLDFNESRLGTARNVIQSSIYIPF